MLYITTPAFTLNMLSMADTLYATDDCTFTDSTLTVHPATTPISQT